MENTSGLGKSSVVPPEIKRWNWGAFLLNVFWGIGNNTYIAFLCLVPLVNVAMPFVLGAKGNEWAWQNKRWESVDHFKRVQKRWAFWGGIAVGSFIVLLCSLLILLPAMMKQSGAYQIALERVHNNKDVIDVLGEPIVPGWWVSGKIEVSGPTGHANISFSVKGSKDSGTIYVRATKDMGKWYLNQLILDMEEKHSRLNLLPPSK